MINEIVKNFMNWSCVGKVVKDNETYHIEDAIFDHLTVSKTHLMKNKATSGHCHSDIEEIYLCTCGNGFIELSGEIECKEVSIKVPFEKGDIVRIPPGWFHKVYNPTEVDMEFICVFENYDR